MTTEDIEYELKIEEPIVTDLFEPDLDIVDVPYKMVHPTIENTTWDQRMAFKEAATKEGFTKGCCVVKRSETEFGRVDPECWGFVTAVVSYCYGNEGYYAPLRCSWIDGEPTYHFPSELIVVNYAPDDIDLGMISRGE